MTEIEKLDALGNEHGCVVYAVHQAAAGWGCQWYEWPDSGELVPEWRNRIVVYNYYPTITEMVAAETERLKQLPLRAIK